MVNAAAAAAMACRSELSRTIARRLRIQGSEAPLEVAAKCAASPSSTISRITPRPFPRRFVRSELDTKEKPSLVAVLEPRSNTLRRNIFQKDLVNSLAIADEVVASQHFQIRGHS